jgi:hypothetical protein
MEVVILAALLSAAAFSASSGLRCVGQGKEVRRRGKDELHEEMHK